MTMGNIELHLLIMRQGNRLTFLSDFIIQRLLGVFIDNIIDYIILFSPPT